MLAVGAIGALGAVGLIFWGLSFGAGTAAGEGFVDGMRWSFSTERASLRGAGCVAPVHVPWLSRRAIEAAGGTHFESCSPDGYCGFETITCRMRLPKAVITCDAIAAIHRKYGTTREGDMFVAQVNETGSITKFTCQNLHRGSSGAAIADLQAQRR